MSDLKYFKYLLKLLKDKDKDSLAILKDDVEDVRNDEGVNIYELSIKHGDLSSIMLLVEIGCDINLLRNNLNFLVNKALIDFNYEALCYFESLGADIKAEINKIIDGKTPLMKAIEEQNYIAVDYLLSKGASPNYSYYYKLPLIVADELGDIKMINILLEYGADWDKAQQVYKDWTQ